MVKGLGALKVRRPGLILQADIKSCNPIGNVPSLTGSREFSTAMAQRLTGEQTSEHYEDSTHASVFTYTNSNSTKGEQQVH